MPHPKVPTLYATTGIPGSGKSTFSRRLEKDGVYYVSRDGYRKIFGEYSPQKRTQIMSIIQSVVKCQLMNGMDVVVDANHVEIPQRAEVFHWAKELWCDLGIKTRKMCLFFPSSLDVSLGRRAEDIASGHIKEEVIRRQYMRMVEPSTVEGFHVRVIDAYKTELSALRSSCPIFPFTRKDLR